MPDCCSDHIRVIRQIEGLDNKVDNLTTEVLALHMHQEQVLPLVRGNGVPPLSERLARIEALQQSAISAQDTRHKHMARALWAVATSVSVSIVLWIGPGVLHVIESIWHALTKAGG